MVIDLREIAPVEEPRNNRNRYVLAASLVVVVALIAAFFAARSPSDPVLAELRVREDRVLVSTKGASFKDASEGQPLVAGDGVRTDANGRAQIDFFETSLTRLDNDTALSISELSKTPQARNIALEVRTGRTWTKVTHQTTDVDHFEVRGGDSVVTVRGTSFVVDARRAPIWYFLGQAGITDVAVPAGQKYSLKEGGCVRVDPEGSERCSKEERDRLIDDWIRENQALDDESITAEVSPSPSPSPSPTAGTGRRRGTGSGSGAGAPAPAPAAQPPPRTEPTREPRETEEPNEPTDEPTVAPTPPPNTDDVDEPPDETDEPDD